MLLQQLLDPFHRCGGGQIQRLQCTQQEEVVGETSARGVWVFKAMPGIARYSRSGGRRGSRPSRIGFRRAQRLTLWELPVEPDMLDAQTADQGKGSRDLQAIFHRQRFVVDFRGLSLCRQQAVGASVGIDKRNRIGRKVGSARSDEIEVWPRMSSPSGCPCRRHSNSMSGRDVSDQLLIVRDEEPLAVDPI